VEEVFASSTLGLLFEIREQVLKVDENLAGGIFFILIDLKSLVQAFLVALAGVVVRLGVVLLPLLLDVI